MARTRISGRAGLSRAGLGQANGPVGPGSVLGVKRGHPLEVQGTPALVEGEMAVRRQALIEQCSRRAGIGIGDDSASVAMECCAQARVAARSARSRAGIAAGEVMPASLRKARRSDLDEGKVTPSSAHNLANEGAGGIWGDEGRRKYGSRMTPEGENWARETRL